MVLTYLVASTLAPPLRYRTFLVPHMFVDSNLSLDSVLNTHPRSLLLDTTLFPCFVRTAVCSLPTTQNTWTVAGPRVFL